MRHLGRTVWRIAGLADRRGSEIDDDLTFGVLQNTSLRKPCAHVLRWEDTGRTISCSGDFSTEPAMAAPSAESRASGSGERSNAITGAALS